MLAYIWKKVRVINNSKKLIDASILTSIFIVLTLLSSLLGLGFLGYYDFIAPIVFLVLFIKTDWKYSLLATLVSAIVLLFIIGDPVNSIMSIQAALLGFSLGFAFSKIKSIGNGIVFVSITCLLLLLVFDFILRSFTNISLISSMGELSQEASKVVNTAIKFISENGGSEELLKKLED